MGRRSSKRAAFSCIIADNLTKCSIVTVLVERCTILGGSFKLARFINSDALCCDVIFHTGKGAKRCNLKMNGTSAQNI